ncbi:MAG: hypothetical protein ACYDGR_15365 [Candidatus Dormibacteria bacterium]
MKVQIRFIDGETLEGESEAANATRMGFPVFFQQGNNQVAWISMSSIKYVTFFGGLVETGSDHDPRIDQNMIKAVLHFADGETMRTYKDDSFSQEGEGFYLRIWDEERKCLLRVLVSLHALKAIFFVNQWDSRTEVEKAQHAALDNASGQKKKLRTETLKQVDELRQKPPG